MTLRRACTLLLVVLVVTACRQRLTPNRRPHELGDLWMKPGGAQIMTMLESGDIVGLESRTGDPIWRYHHFPALRHSEVDYPRSRLICTPIQASDTMAYFIYSDWLISLSTDTGHVRWRQRIRTPFSRSLCPAVAPDSSIAILVKHGHGVAKIRPNGELAWSFGFPDRAVATAGPSVLPRTGNVLVRAGGEIFALTPEGELAWRRATVQ